MKKNWNTKNTNANRLNLSKKNGLNPWKESEMQAQIDATKQRLAALDKEFEQKAC